LYYYYFLAHEKKKPLQPHKVYILSLSLSLSLRLHHQQAIKKRIWGGGEGRGGGVSVPPFPYYTFFLVLKGKHSWRGAWHLFARGQAN
jgi:hypothetical protein